MKHETTLQEAAYLLETVGHTKRAYRDDNGYCAVGALNMVTGGNANMITVPQAIRDAVADVVEEQYGDRKGSNVFFSPVAYPYGVIARFNDHPDTTKEEVISVFEKASARLAEAE